MSDDQNDLSAETEADGGQAQDAGQVNENAPYATFPDADSFMRRVKRDAHKELTRVAKEAGFETWEAMQEAMAGLQATASAPDQPTEPAQTGGDPGDADTTPETEPTATSEAAALRMAIKVAAAKGLPATLALRLQGATEEEMSSDADQLLAAMATPAGPGIPPVRKGGQPVTFTRQQLQNPAFVREHQTDIMRAAAEGRIVES